MIPKISAACFIRDTISGAFCLWESMATIIPLVDEYVIMDFGSTDGTLEILKKLADHNPKIKLCMRPVTPEEIMQEKEKLFATMANEVVSLCRNEIVFYHQSDEIFHEDLIGLLRTELEKYSDIPEGAAFPGLSFWRYQLRDNFQRMKWWPHQVIRIDLKSRFNFIGDGMNSDRSGTVVFQGRADYPTQDWQNGYTDKPTEIPTNFMVLDVSMIGGFLENIVDRRRLHAPLWGESPDVLYDVEPGNHGAVNVREWMAKQEQNPDWTNPQIPFNIPAIMRDLVGKKRYLPRLDILNRIIEG